jgi:thymidylate synthase
MQTVDIILAVDGNKGMGLNGKLPWHSKEELKIFSAKTHNSILIVGKNTVPNLPYLKDRTIMCVSTHVPKYSTIRNWKNKVLMFTTFEEALDESLAYGKKVFVAGGNCLNEYVFKYHSHRIGTVHISIFHNVYDADIYSTVDLSNFVAKNIIYESDFIHCELIKTQDGEKQYIELAKDVLKDGSVRFGRNGETTSLFGRNMKFDLRNGFPLLTTKKVFWRGVVEELLMFLRGDTDTNVLEKAKIFIWRGNTNTEFIQASSLPYKQGVMGPMYGYQWRHFNAPYDPTNTSPKGIDQLADVISLIKTSPSSRRILMTSYNPEQAGQGVLYPCHSIAMQFYVDNGFLDMICFNRSQDILLGVPFNIASSALLLSIVAKITGYIPRYLHMSMGDCHIYKDHYEAITKQLERVPYAFPVVSMPDIQLSDLPNLKFDDFVLANYSHHSPIKAEMVA